MSLGLIIPDGYQPVLSVREVEIAIKRIKDFFEHNLADGLCLTRVSAPLFVRAGTGINDDLNGVEKPVGFLVKGDHNTPVEIIQSLAKWKRMALSRYGYQPGEGIYTDMNAIRPDEVLDNLHSIYVDQWDWEKIIQPEDRKLETLEETVRIIYGVVRRTEFYVAAHYASLKPSLPDEITFVTADELRRLYPALSPRQREQRICQDKRAVFVIGIGHPFEDGQLHDGRAPDYDDWSTPRPDGGHGLNGDILLWNPVLRRAFEISSMGVRVDAESLRRQLEIRSVQQRTGLFFHQMLLSGKLPECIGGGIGQSRLCMFFLRTAHIGEVACGIWPQEMQEECAKANIMLL